MSSFKRRTSSTDEVASSPAANRVRKTPLKYPFGLNELVGKMLVHSSFHYDIDVAGGYGHGNTEFYDIVMPTRSKTLILRRAQATGFAYRGRVEDTTVYTHDGDMYYERRGVPDKGDYFEAKYAGLNGSGLHHWVILTPGQGFNKIVYLVPSKIEGRRVIVLQKTCDVHKDVAQPMDIENVAYFTGSYFLTK